MGRSRERSPEGVTGSQGAVRKAGESSRDKLTCVQGNPLTEIVNTQLQSQRVQSKSWLVTQKFSGSKRINQDGRIQVRIKFTIRFAYCGKYLSVSLANSWIYQELLSCFDRWTINAARSFIFSNISIAIVMVTSMHYNLISYFRV